MHHQHTLLRPSLMLSILAISSATIASTGAARRAAMETIRADDVQTLVDHLASDAMNGRHYKSPEAKKAANFIADQFKASELEPLGDEGTWFQAIDVEDASPNVVGIRRGRGERFLLITAHYDHLRPAREGKDRIYNGADDNASGSAAIIEIAGAFAALDEKFESSIIFVAFTGEEAGMRGSRYFADHPPLALKHAIGILNLDMVSRGKENLLFCEGGNTASEMLASIKHANETIGLDLRFDEHPEWMRQSDQWSLVSKGVAALYFGVEDHADYHKVTDHSDRIIPKLTERAARLVFLAAAELTSAAKTED